MRLDAQGKGNVMRVDTKKIFENVILEKILGYEDLLFTYDAKKPIEEELLAERSDQNKNETRQFTRYFWKLGLDTYSPA